MARAALEAIAWRVCDIVEAIGEAIPVSRLRVDGGLTNAEALLVIQAEALGLPVVVSPPNATALGAAMMSGVGAGVFDSLVDAAGRLARGRVVTPQGDSSTRARRREQWRAFVAAAGDL